MFISKTKLQEIEEFEKYARVEIEQLKARIYELENPKRVTDQNLGIRGDTLYFNGAALSVKPNPYFVNTLRIKPNDTIKNATIEGNDIFISMNSGDEFVLRDYWNPSIIKLERVKGEMMV